MGKIKQHTEPPWEVSQQSDLYIVKKNGNEEYAICEMHTAWDNKERKANAELIAQAPDLLKKVQELETQLETCHMIDAQRCNEISKLKDQVSEQAQRITDLTEALREALPYIKGEFPAYHHVDLREKIEALLKP